MMAADISRALDPKRNRSLCHRRLAQGPLPMMQKACP
jgi:hypothetical protein